MIGPSITIKGEVSGEEDLLIQGRVEGSVNLDNNEVTIGDAGRVDADIQARVARVDGEVAGDITANEKVIISKSGNVRGNIVAHRVTLEDGAIFKGSIDMDPAGASQSRSPQPPANDGNTPLKASGLDLKTV